MATATTLLRAGARTRQLPRQDGAAVATSPA